MKQRLLFLFSMLTFVLVGCSTGTDVTEDYFQPNYEYSVVSSVGRKFFFDEFNENRFSYEGYNYSAPKSDFGLPMDVIKVDNFGEYDVISFIPHFEESLFPEYDWRQESKKDSSWSVVNETTISHRIIFEELDFIIVPFNTEYENTYYMLIPDTVDEEELNQLITSVNHFDFDYSEYNANQEKIDPFVEQLNLNSGYLLKQKDA